MYKKISALCFTIAFFVIIAGGALLNLNLIKKPLDNLNSDDGSFDDFIDEVGSAYLSDDFVGKNFYINLNGLFARLTGRIQYNEVVRLNNGLLTAPLETVFDTDKNADYLSEFNSFLASIGIDFTYIQAPNKCDLTETNIPIGVTNTSNLNADNLLEALSEKGVDYLDLRPILSPDPETAAKHFFVTDHHWNTEGAFVAYGEILNMLADRYPNENIDTSLADKSNWNVEIFKNVFLGSHGKRVGINFAGIDDYTLYTPKFDTDMYVTSMQTLNTIMRRGTFEETCVVRDQWLESDRDLFDNFIYSTYIGGDFPIVKHRNLAVENGLKIMIIKDSYTLPVQSFLSTAISEIDVVDSRHLTNISVAEYVELTRPDAVIMMLNPSILGNSSYFEKLGTERAKSLVHRTEETVIVKKSNITVQAEENDYAFNVVASNLEYNSKYVIRVDKLTAEAGDFNSIVFALYNEQTRIIYDGFRVDSESGYYEWYFTTPEKGTTKLSLLMYAGVFGETAGNTVFANGVTLSKLTAPK